MKELIDFDWDARSDVYYDSAFVTSKDKIQFQIENDILVKNICDGEKIFDIGCGNGATIRYLLKSGIKPKDIGGCDISKKMISIAQNVLKNGSFFTLDLIKNDFSPIEKFCPSIVIHKRVLHNLGGREVQKEHLSKLSNILQPGCKLYLISAFWDGLIKLNILRNSLGLEPIIESVHNDYSRLYDVKFALENSGMIIEDQIDYTSTYYIGSRVMQPFLFPNEKPDYNHFLNKTFSKLPNSQGFGIHQLFIAKKE